MLRYLRPGESHPNGSYVWEIGASPFRAPWDVETPEEFRGYLRALYKENPRVFVDAARDARNRDYYLESRSKPELVPVLLAALVGVAHQHGWKIADLEVVEEASSLTSRGVP